MKTLVIGGDGRIAKRLIPKLQGEVFKTTRRKDGDGIFLDLSVKDDRHLGDYDTVIVCACDFKKGRPDEEQELKWDTNVEGIKRALTRTSYKEIVFLSSYLSGKDTAYGRQKAAVEDWLRERPEGLSIVWIPKLNTEKDYADTVEGICELVL